MIEHLLPRGVELHPLLHEPLLRQRDHLLGRLVSRGGLLEPEIQNQGISGNTVLSNLLVRLPTTCCLDTVIPVFLPGGGVLGLDEGGPCRHPGLVVAARLVHRRRAQVAAQPVQPPRGVAQQDAELRPRLLQKKKWQNVIVIKVY